jgi:hypothetical protein
LFPKINRLRFATEISDQLGTRKAKCERRAGLFAGGDDDLAAMGFDDQLRDVETEPEMGAVTQFLAPIHDWKIAL